jgi:uncharacterized small protein (DUF1192 family)
MIIVKEEVQMNLELLENLLKQCSDEIKLGKEYLKPMIASEISNLKWIIDKDSFENCFKKRDVELIYFETKKYWEDWASIENDRIEYTRTLSFMKKEQEEEITVLKNEIEKLKVEKEAEKKDLMKELTLIEVNGLPE